MLRAILKSTAVTSYLLLCFVPAGHALELHHALPRVVPVGKWAEELSSTGAPCGSRKAASAPSRRPTWIGATSSVTFRGATGWVEKRHIQATCN